MKYTTESFNEILENSNRTIRMIGEYIKSKVKTQFECLVCGYEWPARPNDILNGKGCLVCYNNRRSLSNEKRIKRKNYILKVLEETKRNIIMVGDYINNQTNTLFKCLVCEHEWPVKPNNILSGYGCPQCKANNSKLTLEQRENKKLEVNNELKNRNILLIGEYISAKTETLFKCLVCNYEWDKTPNAILSGNGCPCCANRLPLTFEIINRRLEDANRTVRIIGEYTKTLDDSLFECLECGHQWPTRPGNVLYNNSGCPCCAKNGFDITKPGILYYIKITHEDRNYYKIGITNYSIKERFNKSELNKIEVLSEINYNVGLDAYLKEQEILKRFGDYRYAGVELLKSGNTEIFSVDIREFYENSNFR